MRVTVWRLAGTLLTALLGYGGGIVPGPAVRASQDLSEQTPKLSSSWRQLRTPDLTVVGNASETELRRVLSDILDFRAAFGMLFPGARLASPTPTSVIVFKDFRAFSRFQPKDADGKRRNVGGYASFGAIDNLIVLPASGRADSHEVIFHGYAHYLIDLNTSHVPKWLSEGLADFFSTFRPDYKGASLLGNVPVERLRSLKQGTFMPLRELLSPPDVNKMWRTGDRIHMFYAESWALVHYILVERKTQRRAPFGVYLKAIASGATPDAAFVEAFGADIDTIERELKQYVRRFRFNAFRAPPIDRDAVARTPVERAQEADVRQVQGQLLALVGADDQAEKEFQAALAIKPTHEDARTWLAVLRSRQDRDEDAILLLNDVLRAAPAHVGALYSLGTALARAWRYEAALDAFDRAVALNPRHAQSWLGLSGAAAALQRDAQAQAAFAQATRLENDPGYYLSYLRTTFRIGRNALAAEAAHSYIDRVGFAEESAQYAAFEGAIAHWRARQAADAEALLTAAQAAIPEDGWTASVLQFLQGRLSADRLLAKAKSTGERTEAHAYIGFKLDIAGQPDRALTHFRWVIDSGARNYTEYALVKNELARRKHAAELR